MNGMDGQNKPTEENNMRQNRILNYIGAAGLLLAVCACGKENLNTTADGGNGGTVAALPEGTFVVDYSVSDGETSRAGGEGRPNTSISSLLYLLYDSEGKLVKEREIPGIDDNTTWPLTRENMSWEQREALKDTLNSGSTYTAVFLANVKKDLFGDTQTEELLQNKENLTEAVLYLPQTPFTDSNMYYLWKEKLEYTRPEGASDDSRDNPLSKKIILRRLVSRIDMERVEIKDDAVKTGMGENFDQLLVDGLNSALEKKVNSMKQDRNTTLNNNCDKLLTLLQEKVGTKDDKTTIAGKNYGNYINQLVTNFKGIENTNFKGIENYDLLVSPWTAFNTSKFTFESMHNRMSINDLTSSYDSNITSPIYTYQVTEGKATWIGFASGNFNGITLLKEDGPSLTLAFVSQSITLGKNEKVSYTCNPIRNISYDVDYIGEDYTVSVNMSTYFTKYFSWDNLLTEENGFRFDETNTQTAFKTAIEDVFGKWNSDVSLSIKIPTSKEFTYTTTITKQTNP